MSRKLTILFVFLLFASSAEALTYDEAILKIDWGSIQNGTVILFTKQSDFMHIFSGKSNQYNFFVPSMTELTRFLRNYDFEVSVVEKYGKKIYIIKETQMRMSSKRYSCLPEDLVKTAKETLQLRHPSYVGFIGYSINIDEYACKPILNKFALTGIAETHCCKWGEECCYYIKTGCCPCSCIADKCVC